MKNPSLDEAGILFLCKIRDYLQETKFVSKVSVGEEKDKIRNAV